MFAPGKLFHPSLVFVSEAGAYLSGAPEMNSTLGKAPRHNITTFSIKGLYVTLTISDSQHKRHSQHNKALPLCSVIMPSVAFSIIIINNLIYYYAQCHYAECCGALGKLMASPTNIRLGWKCLPVKLHNIGPSTHCSSDSEPFSLMLIMFCVFRLSISCSSIIEV